MTDIASYIQQIRFAFEQLSERNAQHEWEHLCRHVARERICSNILPATGPVQAGGDQGRDFETFRTFLSHSSLHNRSFVGLVSSRPLAFACTVQKMGIKGKIKADVNTIMSSGSSIEGIYFFCTCDLPVAARHELIEWAQTTHSVELEIFDGAAISELLCNRDLLWVAEKYLQLPSELAPAFATPQEAKDWYSRILDKWRHCPHVAYSYAEFSEIRRAARKALGSLKPGKNGEIVTKHDLPELPFWIEKLDEIVALDGQGLLGRRALYESSVNRLRGLGSLVGCEDRLRPYFAQIPSLIGPDLKDAGTLLTYLVVAQAKGIVDLEERELVAWEDALSNRIDELIRKAKQQQRINERCELLDLRGYLAFFKRRKEGFVDVTTTFLYWNKLVALVPHAPLFPLEDFADNLAKYAEFIGTHPEYDPLVEKVDALVAQRFGQFKVAEKCVDRAKAFIGQGNLSRAMDQIHRAKVDWYAEETLEQSLWALSWLASAYREQKLHLASKYYSLAAAFLALHSSDMEVKDRIAPNLMEAAFCDYVLGAWHSFLDMAPIALRFYSMFARDQNQDLTDENSSLNNLIYYLMTVQSMTPYICPAMASLAKTEIGQLMTEMEIDQEMLEVEAMASERWGQTSQQEIWNVIGEDMAGVPWSDVGPRRCCAWSAYGVKWRVEWDNDYQTNLIAEEFLAMLQIVLSEFYQHDLCLIRCSLNLKIQFAPRPSSDYKGFNAKPQASNDTAREMIINLPSLEQFEAGKVSQSDLHAGALSVICNVLSQVSLLPDTQFDAHLETLMKQGLLEKMTVAASYHLCLGEFIDKENFEASKRHERTPVEVPSGFEIRESEILPWFDGLGPGYASLPIEEILNNRYENFIRPIKLTLDRLNATSQWCDLVQLLRSEGWKDWHLLSVVFHIVMNHRMNERRLHLPTPQMEMQANKRLMEQEETVEMGLVPLFKFTEKEVRQQMQIYIWLLFETMVWKFTSTHQTLWASPKC